MRQRILLSADQIAARVRDLADTLTARFAGEEVVAIVVLHGAMVFAVDLLRAMPDTDVLLTTLRIASYHGTERAGPVRLIHDVPVDLHGRHVLVIEDIVDSGHSLAFLRRHLATCGPASVTVVALLDKPSRREVDVAADLVGFTIEDRFVVGYGLDLDGRLRHLPYIAELIPDEA
jgi:hypoxanthine phosphoribosyltransferase